MVDGVDVFHREDPSGDFVKDLSKCATLVNSWYRPEWLVVELEGAVVAGEELDAALEKLVAKPETFVAVLKKLVAALMGIAALLEGLGSLVPLPDPNHFLHSFCRPPCLSLRTTALKIDTNSSSISSSLTSLSLAILTTISTNG